MRYAILVLSLVLGGFKLSAQEIDTLKIDGSNGVRPLVEALASVFEEIYPNIDIVIGEGMSTSKRIEALMNEDIDIAMASHGLDIPRFTKMGLQVHLFAQMAIVFGVNQSVPIDDITYQDLCAIYQGELVNWQAFGGPALPIVALARPLDEVDSEVIAEQLDCFQALEQQSHLVFHQKSGPLARALKSTEGSIGMCAAVRVAQSEGNIKALSIEGIPPSPKMLKKGKYPFFRNAYLLTKGRMSNAEKRFLHFIRSKTGKRILEANQAIVPR
ncbi:MAG: substrate-binding domain-containing protein [Bacteroidota bacterium]